MAEVDVLVTGYVREGTEGDLVEPTISLVRSADVRMVVDPGILRDPSALVSALAERGLEPADITHVFVTHHHIDHTRNVGLFPTATVVDVDSVYAGDVWGGHAGDGHEIAAGVRVIATPGHSPECASLVVETDDGVVVLTHAWWFTDRTPEVDPLATDQEQLAASRARILALADLVVPGHGAPFRP